MTLRNHALWVILSAAGALTGGGLSGAFNSAGEGTGGTAFYWTTILVRVCLTIYEEAASRAHLSASSRSSKVGWL